MNTLAISALFAFLALCACAATGLLRAPLRRLAPDIPNERSAHSDITPRGGGLAIWLACGCGMAVLWFGGILPLAVTLGFLGATGLATFSGLLDDLAERGIKPEIRLLFHLLAVTWGMAWLGGLDSLQIGPWHWQWSWVEQVILALILVWIINLTNFMDGLNGLAASETLFVMLAAALLAWLAGDATSMLLALLFACAIAGFLPWNIGRAKIFLGDAGAYFLGASIALLSLFSARNGSVSPWCWMILFSLFLADSATALLRRMTASITAWKEPHRTHACQHLSRRWQSHGQVALALAAVNLCALLPLALLAWHLPHWSAAIGIATLAAAMALAYRLGSGAQRIHPQTPAP